MKIAFAVLIYLYLGSFASAQLTTVYGKITNPLDSMVYIRYYKELLSYEQVFADSAKINSEGTFKMQFLWTKPFIAELSNGKKRTTLYLGLRDSLKIELDGKDFEKSIRYSGRGALANNYLTQKTLKFPEATSSSTYELSESAFITFIDSMHTLKRRFYNSYFSKIRTKNVSIQRFMELEEANIKYDLLESKLRYPGFHAYLKRDKEALTVSKNYYNFLQNVLLINPKAIHSIPYLLFVDSYVEGEVKKIYKRDTTKSTIRIKEQFINKNLSGEIKSYILAKWAYGLFIRNSDLVNGSYVFDLYKKNTKNQKYKDVLEKVYQNASRLAIGNPAPGFTLPDINGNKVSLSDFKGKLIYMDIWASWCGPCLMQIPYVKKLEEALRDKDIVFLYVSIDDNTESWKKMVTEKELKGVHLISNKEFDPGFSKLYNVKSIPRYFIIDKNGLISNNNPERPSGNVKEELEKLLGND